MAITFEQKRRVQWGRVAAFSLAVLAIGIATYYLFFAPSPRIELIIPPPLLQVNEISGIEFIDPSQIIRSAAFSVLRDYAGEPGVGALGRPNPFLPP